MQHVHMFLRTDYNINPKFIDFIVSDGLQKFNGNPIPLYLITKFMLHR